jgi:wyosine [tRNA(Phe)-imidazoG37] synthetase (radical SAM superfamily)
MTARALGVLPMMRHNGQYAICQPEVVYGPIYSRRLGRSLGINLFPGTSKVCGFDCTYCFLQVESSDPPSPPCSPDDVIKSLDAFIASSKGNPRARDFVYLTFSGNGEPTLHPQFPEIVARVAQWKEDNFPRTKIALFTNGSRVHLPAIRDACLTCDRVYLKFDWGSQKELNEVSRPRTPVALDHLIAAYTDLCLQGKTASPRRDIILQAAIYPRADYPEELRNWARHVTRIAPAAVDLYELDFAGRDHTPHTHFDFHAFQRQVYDLLRTEPIRIRFFFRGQFYVNVDLCYAVDSLIYMPLYVADFADLFKNQGVRVNHFVSADGDPGAIAALTSGRAQFALCDPQAAFDFLAERTNTTATDYDPVLVAVLIDRLALWAVSDAEAETPREAVSSASRVVTYVAGSTANYVWKWQRLGLLDSAARMTEPVQPGDEFREMCPTGGNYSNCIITADLLGATWCAKYCKDGGRNRRLSLTSYTDAFGKPFLFTGLLASRQVIRDYPGSVDGVIRGFRAAVAFLDDKYEMDRNKANLKQYIAQMLDRKRPWYLTQCSARAGGNVSLAVEDTLTKLTQEHLYSKDGQLRFRHLFYALLVRRAAATSGKLPTVGDMLRWVDPRACSNITRLLITLVGPLLWVTRCRPFRLGLGLVAVFLVSCCAAWLGTTAGGSWGYFWLSASAVFASVTAAAGVTWVLSIVGKRGGKL